MGKDYKKYMVKGKFKGSQPRIVSMTPCKAVKAHCLQCMDFTSSKIRFCPHMYCALRPFRMGVVNDPDTNEGAKLAIANYCFGCSEEFTLDHCDLCLLKPWRHFEIKMKEKQLETIDS
jgi:hypothetical protein